MGMIGLFMQISPEELTALQRESAMVDDIVRRAIDGSRSSCSVGKEWYAMAEMLASASPVKSSPETQAILGGEQIGAHHGCGPARFLEPESVKSVANALEMVSRKNLAYHLSSDLVEHNGVCPSLLEHVSDDCDEEAGLLLTYYERLRAYYQDAASRGNGMLLILT